MLLFLHYLRVSREPTVQIRVESKKMINRINRRFLGVMLCLCVGSGIASASTISYYVDVFGGSSTATLCTGPCPNYTAATLGTGSNQTVFFNIPQFNQLGNIAEGTPTPGYAFTL